MNWLNDLFQGIPLNAVLRERVALAEQKFKEMEQDNKTLANKVTALEAENGDLKQQLASAAPLAALEKPKIKWGCYVFNGEEDRLYCPGCYDSKGKKHLTTRATSKQRICSLCQATLGS